MIIEGQFSARLGSACWWHTQGKTPPPKNNMTTKVHFLRIVQRIVYKRHSTRWNAFSQKFQPIQGGNNNADEKSI